MTAEVILKKDGKVAATASGHSYKESVSAGRGGEK